MDSEFTAQLTRTVDRLRFVSTAQLQRDGRENATRDLITRLAAHARPNIDVPQLSPTALADQLAVIGREFLATATPEQISEFSDALRELRRSL